MWRSRLAAAESAGHEARAASLRRSLEDAGVDLDAEVEEDLAEVELDEVNAEIIATYQLLRGPCRGAPLVALDLAGWPKSTSVRYEVLHEMVRVGAVLGWPGADPPLPDLDEDDGGGG